MKLDSPIRKFRKKKEILLNIHSLKVTRFGVGLLRGLVAFGLVCSEREVNENRRDLSIVLINALLK
jgi:hypothetical protein